MATSTAGQAATPPLQQLPASLAKASQGMATPPPVAMGQAYYQRYYPAAASEDYMRFAIQAAEANPYVDQANAMTAELNKLQAQSDARREVVQRVAREQQAAQAKLNAARIKAAGKAGRGGGVTFTDMVKAVKDYGGLLNDAASMYEKRIEVSDVKGTLDRAKSYGNIDSLSGSARGAMQQLSQTISREGFDPRQLLAIGKSDAEGASAIQAIQASNNDLTRGSAAAAMAELLTDKQRMGDKAMTEEQAAQVAGQIFKVPAQAATAAGKQFVQEQLFGEMKNIVSAGRAEQKSEQVVQPLMNEVIRIGIQRLGAGGRALEAERERQAAEQLNPAERGALDLYLAALRNDGKVLPGEMISIGGGAERALTEEERKAGRAAWEKARKFNAYRPDEAQWFDDEFIEGFQDSIKYGVEAEAAREKALARGSRTPEEVQREMAERFLRASTAARDLEVYVDPELARDPFQQKTIGGAIHIANREGDRVFDASYKDDYRKRRLGGGPGSSAPMKYARKMYMQMSGGDAQAEPLSDEALREGIDLIRKRFRNNPDKAVSATQYFLAQNIVKQRQFEGKSVKPEAAEKAGKMPTPDVNPGGQRALEDAEQYLERRRQSAPPAAPAPAPTAARAAAPTPTSALAAASVDADVQQVMARADEEYKASRQGQVRTEIAQLLRESDAMAANGFTANANALRKQAADIANQYAQELGTRDIGTMKPNLQGQKIMEDYASSITPQGTGRTPTPIQTAGDTGTAMAPIVTNNGSRNIGKVLTGREKAVNDIRIQIGQALAAGRPDLAEQLERTLLGTVGEYRQYDPNQDPATRPAELFLQDVNQ